MKKTVLSLALAASVLSLTACSDSGDSIVATSSKGDLTQAEFYEKIKSLAGEQLLGQILVEQVLEDKYDVTKKEIETEFNSLKEQYGEQFADALAQSGLTEETLKDNIRFQLLQEKAAQDVKVTDEEIKAYYDMASKELKARHILVADEATAKEVIEKIKGGADFAAVAKEYSTDTGSAKKGGDLGWFTIGKMVDEFNDAAYALELNTLSEPVQSQFGYHVIEVTDKRDLKDYGTLEEKKDEIKKTLAAKKGTPENATAKIAELLKDAKVEIKDEALKNALNTYTGDTASEEKKEDDKK